MITPSLKISRERHDHRPSGDETACLRRASCSASRASSISSPQGGGTRLFSFFMKFSGMEGLASPPSGQTNTGKKDNRLDFLRGSMNDRSKTNECNLVNALCSSDLPH